MLKETFEEEEEEEEEEHEKDPSKQELTEETEGEEDNEHPHLIGKPKDEMSYFNWRAKGEFPQDLLDPKEHSGLYLLVIRDEIKEAKEMTVKQSKLSQNIQFATIWVLLGVALLETTLLIGLLLVFMT